MHILKWQDVERQASSNYANFVYNCECDFNDQVHRIADDIFSRSRCKLVLVAGPSASGKTTFTNILANRLEYRGVKVHRISTDDYFKNNADVPLLPSGLPDFDSLNAMDLPALRSVISNVLKGGNINVPIFDFTKRARSDSYRNMEIHKEDITIIEGIHALNPEVIGTYSIANQLMAGVFIRPARTIVMDNGAIITPNNLRLLRRSIRDFYMRGHSIEATLKQWAEVLKSEQEFIYPYRDLAEYSVDSVYPYELFTYKNCFGNVISACDAPEYACIRKAMEEVITKPRIAIPETSLLNEFAIFGKMSDN